MCNTNIVQLKATQQKKAGKGVVQSSSLPLEPPPLIPDNRPADNWPSDGRVSFNNVVVEYAKVCVLSCMVGVGASVLQNSM